MILSQIDVELAATIFAQHFPDAVIVRTHVDERGNRLLIRIVREPYEDSVTLMIRGGAIRACTDDDEYRQLILDAAKEHKFRHALAKTLARALH